MKNALLLVSIVLTSVGAAQTSQRRTYCNPVDIEYRYCTEEKASHISYRSGADPVIVRHKGLYYLFVTNSGGWWKSKDLCTWEFVQPTTWPKDDICAPAVEVVHDSLFLLQSTFDPVPLYVSTDPASGVLHMLNPMLPPVRGALGPWDPDLYYDPDRASWTLYFGSSNVYPIYAVPLDPGKNLAYAGDARPLLLLHPEEHGWERFGRDHRDTIKPYIEGAWMTKHRGIYYLQYAAPGTEYNVYANGTYVGSDPLGPFTYAPYNPVSYKPGGFVVGAGHGNTFEDAYGNYWNTGTSWIGVNFNFERRVVMFPAGFEDDGQMYADTRFGDFPHVLPDGKWERSESLFAGWMLLSYRKACRSSGARDSFPASNVTDENARTSWVSRSNKGGEWISVDLGGPRHVDAVQVNFADYESDIYSEDSTVYSQFSIWTSVDDSVWRKVADLSNERRDRPNAYFELPAPVLARYVKYVHGHVGAKYLAVADIRIFGKGEGTEPLVPNGVRVVRDADRRNVRVKWNPVPGAVGYNIRWGIKKDRLHETYQVFSDFSLPLEIRALSVDQEYFFAVEAFNEIGVSGLSSVENCP